MIPVEKNKEYMITIESVSSEGNGVGHIDGYTVFVPGTVEGDVVRTGIVKVKSSYGYGRLIEVITPSRERREPACESFVRCGGCQLMHMSPQAQQQFKEAVLTGALERIGGFSGFAFEGVLSMEEPYGYRNKMIFPVGRDKNGKTVCGFYAPRSHDIVPLRGCALGDKLNEKILACLLGYMEEFHVPPYEEQSHKGLVRRVFIRTAYYTGEVMVAMSANGTSMPGQEILAQRLRALSERIVSVFLNVNTKKTNAVLGERNILLSGKETIEDKLCGLRYHISPHSFFQINPVQTERLYEKALEYAQIRETDRVMDLYCGIGTISLTAARRAKEVIGVEIVPQAIEDAKKNAQNNGIGNVRFYCDGAERLVPELIGQGERPDVVILDPPRKGSDEATLSAIVKAGPARIVYVSCNPATLARDAKFLAKRGYRLEKVIGVDMFPQTVHVECVAEIRRADTL